MTQPTYYTPDGYYLGAGVPVFVDPPQHSGETMPDRRIEVYKMENGWQPIETAPKDGTPILALDTFFYSSDKDHVPHYVYRAIFFNDEGDWEEFESGEILDDGGPTLWMVLPQIPYSNAARSFTGKRSVPCAVPERES